ncbi:MAG: COG4315 family predicted lipoprotein [Minisyncoccota bacterium]
MENRNKNIVIGIVIILVIFGLYYLASYLFSGPADESLQKIKVSVSSNDQFSSFLVGPLGMTLYFKEGDLNSSSCYKDQCAANWPTLFASGEPTGGKGVRTSDLGVLSREDGNKQITYKGKPLYYWMGDKNPGDVTGDGIENIWSVATP